MVFDFLLFVCKMLIIGVFLKMFVFFFIVLLGMFVVVFVFEIVCMKVGEKVVGGVLGSFV